MNNFKSIQNKLRYLRNEHRDLNIKIDQLTKNGSYDQIQVQRLKKRKLLIKDQILAVEKDILPDIIA